MFRVAAGRPPGTGRFGRIGLVAVVLMALLGGCGSDACPAGSACRADSGADLGEPPDAAEQDGGCREGGTCALPDAPCRLGTMRCGAMPGCIDTGMFAAVGTPCGDGDAMCDGAGGCGACVSGVVCDTGNPCATGAVDCGSGAPLCIPDFSSPPVVTCGTVGVCGAGGACSECIPGVVCDTGNPCTTGRIDCSSGSAVCVAEDDYPMGVGCGPGLACSGRGACSVCLPGAACDPESDAGVDAGSDAGLDAGSDAGIDVGVDAGTDAGPSPAPMSVAYVSAGGGVVASGAHRMRVSIGAPQPAGTMRSGAYTMFLGGLAAGR
jgi:hypothetical protein